MATVKLAGAHISEKGTTYGAEGDQTGKEVCIKTYYNHKKVWKQLAWKNNNYANRFIQAMTWCCNSNKVGYSQKERSQLYNYMIKYNYDLNKIPKCNADCSSMVRACVAYAVKKKISDFTTANEYYVLNNTGYFTGKGTCTSSSKAILGGILVTSKKAHTEGVVSVNGKTQYTTAKKVTSTVAKKVTTTVTGKLTVDGKFGKNSVKKMQKWLGTTQDGVISNQLSSCKKRLTGVCSITYGKGGSQCVKALQKKLGVSADGYLGEKSIKALQKLVGVSQDGYWGYNTSVAFQKYLNNK